MSFIDLNFCFSQCHSPTLRLQGMVLYEFREHNFFSVSGLYPFMMKSPKGAKTALIESAVGNFTGEFILNDLERACPGVSRDMLRLVLRDLRKSERVECLGRGPGALWRGKRGNALKKG